MGIIKVVIEYDEVKDFGAKLFPCLDGRYLVFQDGRTDFECKPVASAQSFVIVGNENLIRHLCLMCVEWGESATELKNTVLLLLGVGTSTARSVALRQTVVAV